MKIRGIVGLLALQLWVGAALAKPDRPSETNRSGMNSDVTAALQPNAGAVGPVISGEEAFFLSSAYQQSACLLRFEEPPGVSPEPAIMLPAPRIADSLFDKPFDFSRLDATQASSGSRIVGIMKLDGVDAQQISRQHAKCAMFLTLPTADNDDREIWDEAGVTLLGMSLPPDETHPRARVLVKVDTDRYTLVHEYLHAVFHRLRRDAGFDHDAFYLEMDERLERWSRLTESGLPDAVRKPTAFLTAARATMDLAESVLTQMDTSILEEMTIETLLARAVRSGEFLKVSPANVPAGAEYALNNYQILSETMMTMVQDLLAVEQGFASIKKGKTAQDVARLDDLRARITRRMEQGQAVVFEMEPLTKKSAWPRSLLRLTLSHPCGTHDFVQWPPRRRLATPISPTSRP